jgi:hypothetical protein
MELILNEKRKIGDCPQLKYMSLRARGDNLKIEKRGQAPFYAFSLFMPFRVIANEVWQSQ